MVQKAVDEDDGKHPKIGTNFLKTFRQYHLTMFTCRHRETSRLPETTFGRLLKNEGLSSSAIKDGLFISYATFLKPMSTLRAYSCAFMMSVFFCTGRAGSDISKFGRFVDGARRKDAVRG